MPLPRPRSIRGQFMAALILFEIIVVGIFTLLLLRQQQSEMTQRIHRRLESQAFEMASLSSFAFTDPKPNSLTHVFVIATSSSSIGTARITDLSGRNLACTDPTGLGKNTLSANERVFLRPPAAPVIFQPVKGQWEIVSPIVLSGRTQALAWIESNDHQDKQDLRAVLRITALWAAFVFGACTLIAAILAQSITRPLGMLTRATRRLIQHPEEPGADFPLPVKTSTEAAELTIAFNRMVAAIEDQ